MYKLLLATDQPAVQAFFRDEIDWHALNFHRPFVAASPEEAIELLNTKPIDAIGYYFSNTQGAVLTRFLSYGRPSLPVFDVSREVQRQVTALKELGRLLDRLHGDYADEPYAEEAMMTLMRDELTHQLLAGEITDFEYLERQLHLFRARVSADEPCILYEIDMPQGEVYMTEHRNHAQERLASALRNNFFGRYVDGIFYAVAVLTPRHIRLAAIPVQSEQAEDVMQLARRADEHVQDSIANIKEYLGLDMDVLEARTIEGLRHLVKTED